MDAACDTDGDCVDHEKCSVCYYIVDTDDELCTGECENDANC